MSKIIKHTALQFLLCIAIFVVSVDAQVLTAGNPTTFSISESDAHFLRYNEYRNSFQYAGVLYKVGEFCLISPNLIHRIVYTEWPGENIILHGSPSQGIDHSLLNAGTTNTFEIPVGESTLKFAIDMSSLAKGTYLLMFKSADGAHAASYPIQVMH